MECDGGQAPAGICSRDDLLSDQAAALAALTVDVLCPKKARRPPRRDRTAAAVPMELMEHRLPGIVLHYLVDIATSLS